MAYNVNVRFWRDLRGRHHGSISGILRSMSHVRSGSDSIPFKKNPAAARSALRLIARSETMGWLSASPVKTRTVDEVREVLVWLSARRVATNSVAAFDAGDMEGAVQLALEGTEHSPMPEDEWPHVRETLGDDMLAGLLHVSTSSLRRYASGERATPEVITGRLHALALVMVDLAGAYNDFGIRRWFSRPRTALDGKSPSSLLSSDWDPEGPEIVKVRNLAAALVGAGAS